MMTASFLLPDSSDGAPHRSAGRAEDIREDLRGFASSIFKKTDVFIFQEANADFLRSTLSTETQWLRLNFTLMLFLMLKP